MIQGRIYYEPDYEFEDKTSSPKLFILLNTPEGNGNCLIVLVTSQPQFHTPRFGCFPEKAIYYLKAKEDFFDDNTWILLHTVIEITQSKLLTKLINKETIKQSQLNKVNLRNLLGCVKICSDFSEPYKKMILGDNYKEN